MVLRDVQLVGFRNRLVSTPQNNDCLSFPISFFCFFFGGGKQYGKLWGKLWENSGKSLGKLSNISIMSVHKCSCNKSFIFGKIQNNYGKFPDLQ
jgi:hypothetical protein